ncbi:MAG: DUF1624 domain-containing protein [Propylenella sp.]
MRVDAPAAASPAARLPLIDAARGVALAAMIVYHFSWDLRYFGYITANVTEDFGWRLFARAIAASFLFIVGVSLVLASRGGFKRRRFLRRLGVIAAAAAAVTVATYFLFPDRFVFFGILHHIAVASVLGLAFVNAPIPVVGAAAVACFLVPPLLSGPTFDSPALNWLGLASYFPRTNDFVPLFPWFGVVLAGIVAARIGPRFWPAGPPIATIDAWTPPPLVWVGRHSLVIYLLHQPILFGAVFLASEVAPPSFAGFEPSYVESCTSACIEADVEADICRRTCDCMAERAKAEGLWRDMMRQRLDRDQTERYFAISDECRIAAER